MRYDSCDRYAFSNSLLLHFELVYVFKLPELCICTLRCSYCIQGFGSILYVFLPMYMPMAMQNCIFQTRYFFLLNKLHHFHPCFTSTPVSEYCVSFSRDKRSDAADSRLSLLSFDVRTTAAEILATSEIVRENHPFIDDDAEENVSRKRGKRWDAQSRSQTYLNADALIMLKTSRKMTSRREQVIYLNMSVIYFPRLIKNELKDSKYRRKRSIYKQLDDVVF